jgi:hypothetical protein
LNVALEAELLEFRRQLYRPQPELGVTDWVESNLVLTERQTESPGPLSFGLRPYAREILEAFNDRKVDDLTMVFGSQSGKTSILMAGVAWSVKHEARPTLWVMPSEHLARSFSKGRWQPLVQDSTAMAGELPPRRQDFTNLEQHFRRCTLNFVGSNSPSNISSRPVGLLIADEVDKFAEASAREASALQLAEQRVKSYSGSKVIRASTPTTVEGEIWQRYLRGDQRRFFVPCFHCGHSQILEWKNVVWDQGARDDAGQWILARVHASARYKCPQCEGLCNDSQKFAMIRKGSWQVTNTNALPGERSYQLSSIYSPDRKCSLGALVVKFLQGQHSLLGLQAFVCGELAEPWEDQSFAVRRRRTEILPSNAAPIENSVRLLTVDVQQLVPFFWLVVREWSKDGHSRLVFAGHCDSWEDVARIQVAHGVEDHRVLIDSGYNSQEVYARCMGHSKVTQRSNDLPLFVGWTPAKSREGRLVLVDQGKKRPSPYFFGRAGIDPRLRIELVLVEWDAESVRDILARMRSGEAGVPSWSVVQFPAGLEVPGAARVKEDTYYQHLESWVRKSFAERWTGKVKVKWASRTLKAADHLLDCELLQVLGAMVHQRLKLGVVLPAEVESAVSTAVP